MGIRIASTWATPPPLSEGETADDEGRYRGRDEAEDSQGDVGSGETGETRTAGLVVDSAGFLHLSDTQWSKYRRLIGMGLNTLEISVEEAKAAPKVEDIDPFYFVRESFVDGWEYGEKVADLSCRDRLSERIIPNLLARDTNGLEYSATLQDDTLLRSMRCGEFAPDRTVYGLFRNPDSVSAQWKQIPLGYRLKFTFAPSGCENLENIRMGLYVFAGKESDIQPPLFASARSGLPAGNVYFKTLTLPNIDVPKFDSAQLPNMAATEVTGFNPAWFERMWLETTVDLFERMESPGEQLISKQELYVKFKGGKPLLIGDAGGSTQYDHTTLSRVDIIDPDGDGEPDFLVETGYGEVYLLRTLRGAIRGRIQIQNKSISPSCC